MKKRVLFFSTRGKLTPESLMAGDAENADSDEIGDLDQKMSDLEEEHSNIIGEHKDYMIRIKKLRASVGELSADLKIQIDSDVADLEGDFEAASRSAGIGR
ncbi:hypothetical protein SASPL_152429 [Salvia splendens]|uniref:Uncharacterized protein n=1 Tax=Salvia splendens TaxID=180675 RepID=A0A8X8Z198_SALSN|nr:hypothetical protein SASPL_152429 [Salvia splendens]